MLLVSLAAVIFAAGFLIMSTIRLGELKRTIPAGAPPLTTSTPAPANILQASENTIPASNLEWLENEVLIPITILKKMLYSSVVAGKVVEIKRESGKLSGLKDYYAGPEKGYYVYQGLIRLKSSQDGYGETFYFSPREMNIMKVTDAAGNEISFDDLKTGSMIEIEETVDLAVSNIDDQNVIALTIKVIK